MRDWSLSVDLLLFRQNEFKNKHGLFRKSGSSWMKERTHKRDLIRLTLPLFVSLLPVTSPADPVLFRCSSGDAGEPEKSPS